jgi:hypothetical protein
MTFPVQFDHLKAGEENVLVEAIINFGEHETSNA